GARMHRKLASFRAVVTPADAAAAVQRRGALKRGKQGKNAGGALSSAEAAQLLLRLSAIGPNAWLAEHLPPVLTAVLPHLPQYQAGRGRGDDDASAALLAVATRKAKLFSFESAVSILHALPPGKVAEPAAYTAELEHALLARLSSDPLLTWPHCKRVLESRSPAVLSNHHPAFCKKAAELLSDALRHRGPTEPPSRGYAADDAAGSLFAPLLQSSGGSRRRAPKQQDNRERGCVAFPGLTDGSETGAPTQHEPEAPGFANLQADPTSVAETPARPPGRKKGEVPVTFSGLTDGIERGAPAQHEPEEAPGAGNLQADPTSVAETPARPPGKKEGEGPVILSGLPDGTETGAPTQHAPEAAPGFANPQADPATVAETPARPPGDEENLAEIAGDLPFFAHALPAAPRPQGTCGGRGAHSATDLSSEGLTHSKFDLHARGAHGSRGQGGDEPILSEGCFSRKDDALRGLLLRSIERHVRRLTPDEATLVLAKAVPGASADPPVFRGLAPQALSVLFRLTADAFRPSARPGPPPRASVDTLHAFARLRAPASCLPPVLDHLLRAKLPLSVASPALRALCPGRAVQGGAEACVARFAEAALARVCASVLADRKRGADGISAVYADAADVAYRA
ncbi:hypothetical protein DIPPA_07895, partial [Diplonema papillatum]